MQFLISTTDEVLIPQAGLGLVSRPRHERAVPFGDQDGPGPGAAAEREVRHQRDDAVAGAGGVQRFAAVWSRGVEGAAAAAGGGSSAPEQEGFSSAVAERDSRLDVLVGKVDAAREPLAAVVLAEQPVGSDVASVVCAILRLADRAEWIGCLRKGSDFQANCCW